MPIGPCLLARASIFVAALNLLAPLAGAVQIAVEDQRVQAPASALVGTTAFGEALGVDGDRMVVGASRLSVQGAGQAGRVYVYERAPDGTWALVQEIASPTASGSNEGFGAAVDGEGDRIVIAHRNGGRAFVYEHVAGVGFELVATLFAELGSSDFGDCIDLEGDRFVVGSISGWLLVTFCPAEGPRSSATMWLIIGCMAMITPVGMLALRKYIQVQEEGREPEVKAAESAAKEEDATNA